MCRGIVTINIFRCLLLTHCELILIVGLGEKTHFLTVCDELV